MFSLSWITSRAWCIVGALLAWGLTAMASCPRVELDVMSSSCFNEYSLQYYNMQTNPLKLCCGIDVETLRAFCGSYKSSMACVRHLRQQCPVYEHRVIDAAVDAALLGSQAILHDLCSDDSLIESYAMHQSCFTNAGPASEKCFLEHLNDFTSGNKIRFLTKVTYRKKEHFCHKMRATVECVRRRINMTCGAKAIPLSELFVKTMVNESSQCDYTVPNPSNHQPMPTNKPISKSTHITDKGRSGGVGSSLKGENTGQQLGYVPSLVVLSAFVSLFVRHRGLEL
ncbi:uncharacterized protein LOC131957903 [Physella acuta]|uniref:uncharacterized protein LOC131957903 n=1 Tax=Physella acuta TaxID=109671 RepID=UPI0027DBEAB7|nr:uncharacterized protein LOC131957903 [Physella acuta]